MPFAVALSSITFTFLHYERGQHWETTTAIVLFAVFACVWAIRSGNTSGVMGWHASWNWLMAVGFELPVTGMHANLPALLVKLNPVGSALLTGGAQGPEGSIWCSIVLLAGIAFVLGRRRPPLAAPAAFEQRVDGRSAHA